MSDVVDIYNTIYKLSRMLDFALDEYPLPTLVNINDKLDWFSQVYSKRFIEKIMHERKIITSFKRKEDE